jgi:hypothetical protein
MGTVLDSHFLALTAIVTVRPATTPFPLVSLSKLRNARFCVRFS